MNTQTKFCLFIVIITVLFVSCAPAAIEEPAAPEELAALEEPAAPAPEPITNLVVALVIDIFSDVVNAQEQGNCSVTPDGQVFKGRGATTSILGEPHGIFVYKDLIEQVEKSDEFIKVTDEGFDFSGTWSDSLSAYPWIKRYDLYVLQENVNQGLMVAAVDTDGLDLVSITNNIPRAMDLFNDPNGITLNNIALPSTAKFVVNMSFVLIPCDPLTLGIDAGDISSRYFPDSPSFDETFYNDVNGISSLMNLRDRYFKLYDSAGIYDSDTINKLVDEATFQAYILYLVYDPGLSREWQYDDFYYTMEDYFYNRGLDVVFVGAAGNIEDEFSYAPASWDFIVSISSEPTNQDVNNGLTLANYSNLGEIMMNGVFPNNENIVGTSFAAPLFSYQIARYLVKGGSSPCAQNPNIIPVLGYAETKDPWSHQDNNLAFADGMNQYCP